MGSKPLATRLREKRNHPPPDQPWVWLTRELIESDAWRSLSLAARRVLERVMLEQMAHAGTANGLLAVTWVDFERAGVRRKSIKAAVAECAATGLLIVTEKGRPSARKEFGGVRVGGVRKRHTQALGGTLLPATKAIKFLE